MTKRITVLSYLIVFLLLFNEPCVLSAAVPSVSSTCRNKTIRQLEYLIDTIDTHKEKFSNKNTPERIYRSYLDMLENTINLILTDAAPAAYERGLSGEKMNGLATLQNTLESMLAESRNNLVAFKDDNILSNVFFYFSAKKIKSSTSDIIFALDDLDITLLLYDLYWDGWSARRETLELPEAMSYEDVIANRKTYVPDVFECVTSKELAKRLTTKVFNIYDGNLEVYISNDGTKKPYYIPTTGTASSDFVFVANKYDKYGNCIKEGYYSAVQCFGMALFAYDKLFFANLTNDDGLSRKEMVNFDVNALEDPNSIYNLFVEHHIDTGAHIRTIGKNGSGGHSMIIISYNKWNILLYEGNYDGSYGLRYCSMSWSTFSDYVSKKGIRKINYICMPLAYDSIVHGQYN